jgi:hypothetical protein
MTKDPYKEWAFSNAGRLACAMSQCQLRQHRAEEAHREARRAADEAYEEENLAAKEEWDAAIRVYGGADE